MSNGKKISHPDFKDCGINEITAMVEKQRLKWLSLSEAKFKDPKGTERVWEVVGRTTKVPGVDADAVDIIATKSKGTELLLVCQFRPPLERLVIEFPAGLIEKGGSIESTAIRELKEETGYIGKIKGVDKSVALEAGMSSATTALVYMEIDDSVKPEAEPEPGEFITTFSIPFDKLLPRLIELNEHPSVIVDGKVMTYARGIEFGRQFK